MVTKNTDVKRFYTGGSNNANPQQSLGGTKSSVEIPNETLNAAWDDVSPVEASLGDNEVRCFVLQYVGVEDSIRNVVIHLASKAGGQDDSVFYGHDNAFGVNQVPPARANENDVPSTVAWSNGSGRANGMTLAAKLNKNDFIHYYMKRTVKANAQPLPLEDYTLEVQFDPLGGTGQPPPPPPGDGGGGGTDDGGGGTGGADFHLAVMAGDFSTTSNCQKTHDNMKKRVTEGAQLVMALGDLGYESKETGWTGIFSDLQKKMKGIVMGNHETIEGAPSGLADKYLSWVGQSKQWHSFNLRNTHWLVLSPYADKGGTGTSQYNFAKSDLEAAAKNANIDWIFICYHEPFFASGQHHTPSDDGHTSFVNNYWPLFEDNEVDAVFGGHNHNYHRTLPITKSGSNPTGHNESENPDFKNVGGKRGIVQICVGTGGKGGGNYSTSSVPSWMATPDPAPSSGPKNFTNDVFDGPAFGYLLLDMSGDGRKLTGRFYSNSGNTLRDEWSLTKGSSSTPTVNQYTISAMTASSDDGTNFATLANDNDLTTKWRTTSGVPSWIKADLGSTKAVTYIKIAWYEGSPPDGRIHTFNVEYSTDNTNWTVILGDRVQTKTDGSLEQYNFPNSVNARYIRVNIKDNDTNNHAGMFEFDVFGTT